MGALCRMGAPFHAALVSISALAMSAPPLERPWGSSPRTQSAKKRRWIGATGGAVQRPPMDHDDDPES